MGLEIRIAVSKLAFGICKSLDGFFLAIISANSGYEFSNFVAICTNVLNWRSANSSRNAA
jgi:hypothetical protein